MNWGCIAGIAFSLGLWVAGIGIIWWIANENKHVKQYRRTARR